LGLEDLDEYASKDRKYTIIAIPITTRRFGPSESLKKTNMILDNTMDVMPKIIKEVFFDLRFIE
jgi:hypothetical protein